MLKMAIRYFKMMVVNHQRFLPHVQQELDLNKDDTWRTKKGEGEKLRDDD